MDLKVQWSTKAENEFDDILSYWNNRNKSFKYSIKLLELFNESIDKLTSFPKTGRITENPNVRFSIIKDYFIYYSFDKTTLYIIDICDMRRDPDFIRSLFIE